MSTEPKRLLLDDPGFAHLVAASNKDGPSNAQIEKALSAASRVAAPPSRWLSWLGARAVIGIGVIGISVVVVNGMRATTPATRPSAIATPASASAIIPVPSEPATPAPIGAPVMTISVDDLATAPAVPSADVSARKARAKLGENIDAKRATFEEEVALVAAARSALGAGDAASCMRSVERYRERFGAGTFGQEIEVIRIEALVMSGDREKADAAASRFLQANPSSPYAERVRSIAGG